ncbi:MAG: hypothetical protein A2284_02100 [Deltaproteobacteria bacterium RIFOXYA12_FULL_61_11]|nr:MAG: hypothetical protein A2284_02100 [Deltaproteobacteria bacterium RIFOXYA12_FULL_61_11]
MLFRCWILLGCLFPILLLAAPGDRVVLSVLDDEQVVDFLAGAPAGELVFSMHGVHLFRHPPTTPLNEQVKIVFVQPAEEHLYHVAVPSPQSWKELAAYGTVLHRGPGFCLQLLDEGASEKVMAVVQESPLVLDGGVVRVLLDEAVAGSFSLGQSDLPPVQKDERIASVLAGMTPARILATMRHLESYPNRHHRLPTANVAPEWIQGAMRGLVASPEQVRLFEHKNTPQRSVLATIPGTSPHRVVLGAHLDSLASKNSSNPEGLAPGADDDASGVGAMLAIMASLRESKLVLKHTVDFVAFAGEEGGLLGSQEVAKDYRQRGLTVLGMLQLDMNAYLRQGDPLVLYFVKNGTSAELNTFAARLIETYLGLPCAQQNLYLGTSDHASFMQQGFPAIFPGENPRAFNNAIHTKNDTTAVATALDFSLANARLALAFVLTLGEILD